jgi:hypothetical protein
MSRRGRFMGRHAGSRRLVATVLAGIAFAVMTIHTHAEPGRARPSAMLQGQAQAHSPRQTSKIDARPGGGEWRSLEQFDNQPRATVVVEEDGAALAGRLTLLGMTRGADDRAALRIPFRGASWNGTTLSFETVLPDNEGKTRWELRVVTPGKATLYPTADNGARIEDGPSWEMSRR